MQAARGASLSSAGDSRRVGSFAAPHLSARPRRIRLCTAVAVATYLSDVTSKVVAVGALAGRPDVSVVPGLLRLHLTRNPGAAFSVATGATVLLSLLAAAVVVVLLRAAGRLRDRTWAVAFGLLLGGALGNLTDRLLRAPGPFRGYVVDFLELPHWPVFNVADTAIVAAAVLVVVQSVRGIGVDGRG